MLAFLSQWLDFFDGLKLWWYVAGGYTGVVVGHAVLSQRDGYCVSLTHSTASAMRKIGLVPIAWILEWIGASSARRPAVQYLMPYKMKTGWGPFFSNMIFWTLVIGAKGVFDWYAVMQTMKKSVLALMNADWPSDLGIDLDIILVIGRVLPGFIVMMNNMQVGLLWVVNTRDTMMHYFQLYSCIERQRERERERERERNSAHHVLFKSDTKRNGFVVVEKEFRVI